MKRALIGAALCLLFASTGFAQQSTADQPATEQDIERYLQVINSHEMMQNMMGAMMKPLHQMIHDQVLKTPNSLPPDFEAAMNHFTDDLLKDMPLDAMMNAQIPVYQKYFTKGDVDALVTFYSTPVGQKVLHELPAITADAMQAMMPVIQPYMENVQKRIQQQAVDLARKYQQERSKQSPPVIQN